jgi:ribosomal protein S18 acetylase RimI-like enzyme
MRFTIVAGEESDISDQEISGLLSSVYVEGGYTEQSIAKKIFEPSQVRNRGKLFAAREWSSKEIAGMIIVVPHDSPAAVRAAAGECELHLLGVKPEFRGSGLGRLLVTFAINYSKNKGYSKIVLWTQKPMLEAQRLYESSGFLRVGEMAKKGTEFFVYEMKCT